MSRPHRPLRVAIGFVCGVGLSSLSAPPARAIDGDSIGFGTTTYYEGVVGSDSASLLESSDTGLPTELELSDSSATVEYSAQTRSDGRLAWTAKIRNFSRPHERVEAVYHVIAILPLPADAEGRSVARPAAFGIVPREGTPEASVPLIYSGEKIVLKRSHALERTLLPNLIGSEPGQLPSLAGTGYAYTFWDAIVRYDPAYGDTLQAFVDFQYTTDPGVAAPDAKDDRLKAYVVTWIPALDPSVPPFAVRLDVVPAE
jgi:hypothetical protein